MYRKENSLPFTRAKSRSGDSAKGNIQYETTEQEVYIRITDLLGRELMSKKNFGEKNTEVIATQNWSNGTYIYEIKSVNRRVGSGIFMISQ